MGGTNILDPLKAIYEEKRDPSENLARHLFLLTDGGVENTDDVIDLIRENNTHTRVHTFGIGYSASPRLIFEGAVAGLGSTYHSSELDPKLNSKVINCLRKAAKPCYTQLGINWGENKEALKYEVSELQSKNYYEDEPFHLNVIFDKEKLVKSKAEFRFYNTLTSKVDTYNIDIDPSKMIEVKDNELARASFQFAATDYINLNKQNKKNLEDSKEIDLIDKEILKVALEYSILTQETSFFGKIKNKKKSGKELKSVTIPAPIPQIELQNRL